MPKQTKTYKKLKPSDLMIFFGELMINHVRFKW